MLRKPITKKILYVILALLLVALAGFPWFRMRKAFLWST